jgi:hypothetical protein
MLLVSRYAECVGMMEGMQQHGEPCALNEECAGDSYCHFNKRECPGTCAARLPLGSVCNASNDVCSGGRVTGTKCIFDTMNAHVVVDAAGNPTGHCVEGGEDNAAGAGEPCGSTISATAAMFVNCPNDLFCDYGAPDPVAMSMLGTCQTPLAIGAACNSDQGRCENGGVCVANNGPRTCQRLRWLAKGAACQPANVFSAAVCDMSAGLICVSGVCQAQAGGKAGDACGDTWPASCAEGLRCDTQTCVALQPQGGPCTQSTDCVSGACGPTRTCRASDCDADPA